MEKKRTSIAENSLIWFGAGLSIAEILTGTYLAPLGFKKGLAALLLGHLIGGLLMLLAGLIGGKMRQSAMETTARSFGRQGSRFFALLNVIQLIGWTAIMIYDGALAAREALKAPFFLWCAVIGGLIIVWILVGVTNLGKLNTITMAVLFILTLVLSGLIFRHATGAAPLAGGQISFGAAVELSVAMPLSWLPLISDYTREAKKPVGATVGSVATYTAVSCWMYIIGMGAAILTGESDIAKIMVKAGLGLVGLLIIIFSTVTTTFLDAYSAGVSGEALSAKVSGKKLAVGVTVFGIVAASLFNMDNITNFLYFIGSVFAPMIAIQIVDFFLLHRNEETRSLHIPNMIVWLLGFIAYRLLMQVDIPVGNTLPCIVITALFSLAAQAIVPRAARPAKEQDPEKNV